MDNTVPSKSIEFKGRMSKLSLRKKVITMKTKKDLKLEWMQEQILNFFIYI